MNTEIPLSIGQAILAYLRKLLASTGVAESQVDAAMTAVLIELFVKHAVNFGLNDLAIHKTIDSVIPWVREKRGSAS